MTEDKINVVRREFELDGAKYHIKNPTVEDIRKADIQYSKAYIDALKEGVPTSALLRKILREQGVITDELTSQIETVQQSLSDTITRLREESDAEKKAEIAKKIRAIRAEIYTLNEQVTGPLNNACEDIADSVKSDYLVFRLLQKEDGSSVWPTYEAYIEESANFIAIRAKWEVMFLIKGLSLSDLENLPEEVALRELEEAKAKKVEDAPQDIDPEPKSKKKSKAE